MRKEAELTTLCACCIELFDVFAKKAAANPRLKNWFPLKQSRRSARNKGGEVYQEIVAKTDRLMNSLLFYYRWRLNEKVGKINGKRNRKY